MRRLYEVVGVTHTSYYIAATPGQCYQWISKQAHQRPLKGGKSRWESGLSEPLRVKPLNGKRRVSERAQIGNLIDKLNRRYGSINFAPENNPDLLRIRNFYNVGKLESRGFSRNKTADAQMARVIKMYECGVRQVDIAAVLRCDVKQVRNALVRARRRGLIVGGQENLYIDADGEELTKAELESKYGTHFTTTHDRDRYGVRLSDKVKYVRGGKQ